MIDTILSKYGHHQEFKQLSNSKDSSKHADVWLEMIADIGADFENFIKDLARDNDFVSKGKYPFDFNYNTEVENPLMYWIKEMVINDFISTNNLSARTKNINMQILEERKKIQEEIKGIKTQISQIEQTLELKAKQLVSTNFSIFALEDAETTKNELSNIKRELNAKQWRLELLKKITIERLNIIIKKFRKRWHGIDNYEELGKFIYDLFSKVVITNEEIKAYINYDMITGKLCDFDIEISSIKRDLIMKIWRHNQVKNDI